MDFRAEFFNLFNRVQFALLNTSFGGASFWTDYEPSQQSAPDPILLVGIVLRRLLAQVSNPSRFHTSLEVPIPPLFYVKLNVANEAFLRTAMRGDNRECRWSVILSDSRFLHDFASLVDGEAIKEPIDESYFKTLEGNSRTK